MNIKDETAASIILISAFGLFGLITYLYTDTTTNFVQERAEESEDVVEILPEGWTSTVVCNTGPYKEPREIAHPDELTFDKDACPFSDPGFSDLILYKEGNSDSVSLSADYKDIFYDRIEVVGGTTTYSLIRAHIPDKTIHVLDVYTFENSWDPDYKVSFPLKIDDTFIIYSWFADDPQNFEAVSYSPYSYLPEWDWLKAKVISVEDHSVLYQGECMFDQFALNYDISEDHKHILLNCAGKIYLSDWVTTEQITFPPSIGDADRVSFQDNDRIRFADLSDEISPLRYPIYSVDLNGGDLKREEGTYYGGF